MWIPVHAERVENPGSIVQHILQTYAPSTCHPTLLTPGLFRHTTGAYLFLWKTF